MAIVFLSLGSNTGNREQYLLEARNAIQRDIGEIILKSSIYESEAEGFAGNPFYNQVLKVHTALLPESLLKKTEEIEKKMGRTQKTVIIHEKHVYTNRIIDIDILLYDDLKINTATLTIPHPRMYERAFVMQPLNEVIC